MKKQLALLHEIREFSIAYFKSRESIADMYYALAIYPLHEGDELQSILGRWMGKTYYHHIQEIRKKIYKKGEFKKNAAFLGDIAGSEIDGNFYIAGFLMSSWIYKRNELIPGELSRDIAKRMLKTAKKNKDHLTPTAQSILTYFLKTVFEGSTYKNERDRELLRLYMNSDLWQDFDVDISIEKLNGYVLSAMASTKSKEGFETARDMLFNSKFGKSLFFALRSYQLKGLVDENLEWKGPEDDD